MARTFTVSQLLTRARQRAEQENSSFVSDAELKGILSSAYAELHSMLVNSGARYFESTDSWTSAVAATRALQSDYLSTVAVNRVYGSGRRRPLHEIGVQESHVFTGSSNGGDALGYSVIGSNLTLYPTPPSGLDFEHIYVPQPTDLSSADDATSVDVVIPAGEQFVDACLQVEILAKEESDVGGALAKRERAREHIEYWAAQRVLTTMRRPVVNEFDPTDNGDRPDGWWWP